MKNRRKVNNEQMNIKVNGVASLISNNSFKLTSSIDGQKFSATRPDVAQNICIKIVGTYF